MTPSVQPVSPFAMLLDPDATLAAIQRSERLARLHSRICRPLDRVPATGPVATDDVELAVSPGPVRPEA